ncbi:MAG: hypothetical protein ACPGTS_01780 [Minisyncoccia bacterium]
MKITGADTEDVQRNLKVVLDVLCVIISGSIPNDREKNRSIENGNYWSYDDDKKIYDIFPKTNNYFLYKKDEQSSEYIKMNLKIRNDYKGEKEMPILKMLEAQYSFCELVEK